MKKLWANDGLVTGCCVVFALAVHVVGAVLFMSSGGGEKPFGLISCFVPVLGWFYWLAHFYRLTGTLLFPYTFCVVAAIVGLYIAKARN